MEDWILRTELQHDWISLVFLFNFILLAILRSTNTRQFKTFIRFIDPKLYFKIYGKDNFLFQSFTALGTVFLLINLCLGVFYCLTIVEFGSSSFSFFITLLILIVGMIFIRFVLLKICFKLLGIDGFSEIFIFKTLSYQIQISILSFFLFLFYEFSYPTQEFLKLILILIAGLYLLSQLSLYREYWGVFKHHLLYLILYLCTFKLAPWILLYSTLK
jgi:hypothetical protein